MKHDFGRSRCQSNEIFGENRTISRSTLLTLAAATGLGCICLPVQAQQTTPGFEPLNVARDPNGVDVLSGKITMPVPTLQIPIIPSLTIGRIQDIMLFASTTAGQSGDSLSVSATFKTGSEVSESFSCIDGDCKTESARPGSLVASPQSDFFLYTEGVTGRKITYDKLARKALVAGSAGISSGKTQAGYWASEATYADGEVLTYDYDIATYSPSNKNYRIAKVTSSRGFELRIAYAVAATDIYNVSWAAPANASIYTSGASPVLLGSIAYGSGTITDMAGNVWAISYGENGRGGLGLEGANYKPPTNATEQLLGTSSVADKNGGLLSTLTKDGTQVWNYAYSHALNNSLTNTPYNKTRTVTVTGPAGYQRVITVASGCDPDVQPGCKPYSFVTQEKDALNRTTKYSYTNKRLSKIEMPEGNAIELVYDLMGNVTKKTQIAKVGSGLPNIVEEALYPDAINCLEGGLTEPGCYRPIWVKDAKGNVTDYVWDSATGQLVKEAKPATASGIRPEVLYEYDSPHGKGISLKVKESMCITSAATGNASAPCAGGATDEVVTRYEYLPNLLLNGVAVTATGSSGALETLRTCYTYDPQGRKISETQPMGTGSTCP